MKFLCVVFVDEQKMASLSPSEAQALDDASLDHDQALRQTGRLIAAHALEPVHSATTVRVRKGKKLITDGPFAETKEQVGGFLLIEARDREEAVQLASEVPVAAYGSIEVRAVHELVHSSKVDRTN